MGMQEQENRRYELWQALKTRELTREELVEVACIGVSIATPWRVALDGVSASSEPYDVKEKLLEVQNALLIRQMLRAK